jgi:hypothetical protein
MISKICAVNELMKPIRDRGGLRPAEVETLLCQAFDLGRQAELIRVQADVDQELAILCGKSPVSDAQPLDAQPLDALSILAGTS